MGDMIKRLHSRFILIATVSIFLIVAVALGVINGTLYMVVRQEIHSVVTYIAENGGSISAARESSMEGWPSDGSWVENTPEFSYQTRYFSVLLDRNGEARVINVNHIAAFTAEEAVKTAAEAVQSGTSEGFFKKKRSNYAYKVISNESGDFLVVILDCTRDMTALNAFLRYSSMFGLLCILLFVVIVSILSKRALRPFIENAENQRRFITNAGHELKTPIAIISANAEAIELISGKSEWTANILKQVSRLSNLINDMITLTKVGEMSARDIALTEVNLSEIVRAGAEAFRTVAEEQGKHMTAEVKEGIWARAEPRFAGELLNILLDNAAKYCDEGGHIRVSMEERRNGREVVIRVSNDYKNGKGMDCRRLFERFYRGDTSHNSDKSGYGIGLSMAEDMAKLMHGKIGAHWENGIMTFRVQLVGLRKEAAEP